MFYHSKNSYQVLQQNSRLTVYQKWKNDEVISNNIYHYNIDNNVLKIKTVLTRKNMIKYCKLSIGMCQ